MTKQPLEQAVIDLATAPDSVFGFDLTPFKSAIADAAKRIGALEKSDADLKARVAKLEAASAAK